VFISDRKRSLDFLCMHRIRAQINQLAQEYSAAISEHETADAVVAVSQPSTCPHILLSLSSMAGCMLFDYLLQLPASPQVYVSISAVQKII
jgi:hypothetical protein